MRNKQPYQKVLEHILDVELADILLLNDEEKTFVTFYLSGISDGEARLKTAKKHDLEGTPNYPNKTKVKQYIAISIKRANEVAKKNDGEAIITVAEVVEELADMIRDREGQDGRVRVKSGEVLLKHLNGFSKHNESKASKTLIAVNGMTDDELIDRIKKLQNSVQQTINIDTSPQLLDLGQLSDEDIYNSFEVPDE